MSAFDPLRTFAGRVICIAMGEPNEGYTGAGTVGGRWGCALSVLVGLPLLGFAFLVSALGGQLAWELVGGAVAVTAIVGFGSRIVINEVVRRVRPRS